MRRRRRVVGSSPVGSVRPSVRRCRGSLGKWARIGCLLGRLTVPVAGLSALLQPASAPLPTPFLFARVTRRCARAAGPGRLWSRRRRSTGRTCLVWLRVVGVAPISNECHQSLFGSPECRAVLRGCQPLKINRAVKTLRRQSLPLRNEPAGLRAARISTLVSAPSRQPSSKQSVGRSW